MNSFAFSQGNFIVEGKFKNYDGKVYLLHEGERDSVFTKHGQFKFKGKVSRPEFSYISIPNKNRVAITAFWVDKGKTVLELDTVPFKNSRFSGVTVKTKVLKAVDAHQTIAAATKGIAKINLLSISEQEKVGLKRLIVDSLLQSYPNSIISLYILHNNDEYYNNEELQNIYLTLDPLLAKHSYALAIKTKYTPTVDVVIGEKLLDFSQVNTAGKMVSLSTFKGKYVLVDFWASWCVPCREENPIVLSAYNKYNSKGFDIIGISLDDSKEAWVKAIKDDGLTWEHLSDLGGWNNVVSKTFKIKSVPSNILIDKEGVVIAKNLRGEDLEKKLEELFSAK